ncbi:MAG: flagellar biosynthesis protein FlhB [Alphaproteobacteria bacterium]
MADDNTDQSQKTEEPTHKRLQDAREKGQVAVSREVNHWFMILAGTIVVMMLMPSAMTGIRQALTRFLEQPHAIVVDRVALGMVMSETLSSVGYIMLPIIVLLIGAAFAAGVVQNGFLFAPDQLKPKLEKISIGSGIKRLFSMKSLMEFLKGIFKLVIVGGVATMVMLPEVDRLESLVTMEVMGWVGLLHIFAVRLLIGVLAIVSLIAGMDFLFQRMQHTKQMRMSLQEIKDEMKQTDGDPQVKGRLRQIRRERAQQRMMQAVPEASVVVTNPTHFAVALKYDIDTMQAPLLLAKGADHVAAKIREIAEENDVPIVRNPPLSRALYASVEIGEEIPTEHYKAVAEVIGYVLRLKGKLPRAPAS